MILNKYGQVFVAPQWMIIFLFCLTFSHCIVRLLAQIMELFPSLTETLTSLISVVGLEQLELHIVEAVCEI